MRFLVDAQLPPMLARWLTEAGHYAQHVQEVGLGDAEDASVWRFAEANRSVLVTKDEDFAERVRRNRPAPVIVWLRIGNVSSRFLRQWFLPQLPQIITWIEAGAVIVEVR